MSHHGWSHTSTWCPRHCGHNNGPADKQKNRSVALLLKNTDIVRMILYNGPEYGFHAVVAQVCSVERGDTWANVTPGPPWSDRYQEQIILSVLCCVQWALCKVSQERHVSWQSHRQKHNNNETQTGPATHSNDTSNSRTPSYLWDMTADRWRS